MDLTPDPSRNARIFPPTQEPVVADAVGAVAVGDTEK